MHGRMEEHLRTPVAGHYGVLVMLCSALLGGCQSAPASRRGGVAISPGMTIKAMTFNIRVPADAGDRSWERRREVAAQVLRARQPDVVGFQELVPLQRQDLLALARDYAAIGQGREKDEGGESCAIFYLRQRWNVDPRQTGTFWYSDTPEEPGSSHWGNRWVRICTWARVVDRSTGRGFYVYNNHWDFSEAFHRRAVGLLQQRMAQRTHPAEPVIVMGDFNATPGSKGPGLLLAQESLLALEDVWVLAHPGEEGFSFHNFTGAGTCRIDFLLGSKGTFEVLRAEVIHDREGDVWPSDHFPVWAELRFR